MIKKQIFAIKKSETKILQKMQYLFYILVLLFSYINYQIILSDIQYKIIPNRFLGYLLLLIPFYYTYLLFSSIPIDFLGFLLQIILAIGISFVLYYLGVWSPGDAKYILVLVLFIPHIGMLPFIGNIILLTIFYLSLYFIYFYFGKCLFNWKYANSLYEQILTDIKDTLGVFLKHQDGNYYKKTIFLKLIKWTLLFLVLFVSMRLARLYFFVEIQENISHISWLVAYIEKYIIYFIIGIIAISIGISSGIQLIVTRIKAQLIKKGGVQGASTLHIVFIGILFSILISFIIYEFSINPEQIKLFLIRICTISISIYISIRIFMYSYRITFQIAEQDIIDIHDLKIGDIVDKVYLLKMFGEQSVLGYCLATANEEEKEEKKKGFLYPDPKEYLNKMDNPIDDEGLQLILKIYEVVNTHLKETHGINENNSIKILSTFAFGGYILTGFILTFIFGDAILRSGIQFILSYIK